ncbi:class I SAM-dependent methyltransferase [Bacillus cereus]
MTRRSEAEHWNEVFADVNLGKPQVDFWLEKYEPMLELAPDGPVIDLGCGYGSDSLFLTERGYRVIACDFSSESLAIIRKYVPGVETNLFDMTGGLPFPDGSARAVVADLSLHYFHWDDTVSIVSEIARVVGTGGLLLARLNSTCDAPARGSNWNPVITSMRGGGNVFLTKQICVGCLTDGRSTC